LEQIAQWLEKLGMSEYAQRFAENRIDLSVLPDLTDQDLKDLGVVLGDRRKILRAIVGLKTTEPEAYKSKSNEATSPSLVTEAATLPRQEAAERRQVTVMFSDLVGSTALSARMDPEDLREVISAYQKCVAETVGRFGGRSTWAMECSFISATHKLTRTTQSGPCARGWNWWLLWAA
jgi:SAM domain (Sterile alpha motif)/Adenylate and Guanylate cyclase catalytic domain